MKKFLSVGLLLLFSLWVNSIYAQDNNLQQQFEEGCDMLRAKKITWNEWGRLVETLAEKGHEQAQCCAGVYYEMNKDYKKALYWFEKAAEQGNGESLYTIGNFYMNGWGVEVNLKKSFEYWLKATEYGDDNSMVWVGNVYQYGWDVVDIDVYEAFKYYKMAAELGNEAGQFHVGECYQNGIGTNKNLHEAKIWFRRSAEQGDERAIEELKKMEQ